MCNNYGDLLTEMEYNTYNYVVNAILSTYEMSRSVFITLDFAFLFTYITVRSTQRLNWKDTTCIAILITVAQKGQRVAQARFAATLQTKKPNVTL